MLSLRFRDVLPATVADELDHLSSQIRGFFRHEHNEDGTHADVTVDSVTLQGAQIGEIVNLPHDVARYSVNGGTSWTVDLADQNYLRYSRIGQVVFLQFRLQQTNVAGAPDFLVIRIPELHAIPTLNSANFPAFQSGGFGTWIDGVAPDSGIMEVSAIAESFTSTPTTAIYLQRYGHSSGAATFAQWPTSSNVTVVGSITFLVEPDNVPTPFFGS